MSDSKGGVPLALKCGLLLVLIVLTNQGFEERLRLIVAEQRLLTTTVFCLIWAISLTAVMAAAFHPSMAVRLVWAIPMAISGAAAYGYYFVQSSEFFIFDVLNFWTSRHEVHRASQFYSDAVWPSVAVFVLGTVAIAMPTAFPSWAGRRVRYWSPWLPILPILLIAGIVVFKEGKGSYALPKQFSPLSLAAIAAYKINTGSFEEREGVSMTPERPLARAVVVVVDESIRSDFISLEPGSSVTPELARLREHWIDFSPAVSSGNCSHLSNAMLRFMADRRDLIRTVHTSPTVWQYAKRAGFRTVFIDAQAGFITVYGKLQNYMTPAETVSIDRLYKIDHTFPSHALDEELVRLVLKEIRVGDRVFIYANKNGAHFPYSNGSPNWSLPDEPQAVGVDASRSAASLHTYAKAVRWSTDRTMSRLIREADWSDATLIYTSDHGQNFSPGRLTHCSSSTNVDPNEAIVPLMVAAGDAKLQGRFEEVAGRYPGHATHFAIAPTLLELMGYQPSDIAMRYEGSLLGNLSWKPQFVSDDILGLFSTRPAWHEVDPMLQKRYRSLDDLFISLAGTPPNT